MTKKELIDKIQERLECYSRKDVAFAVNLIFGAMNSALLGNERIEIRGFGNFTVRNRRTKHIKNPKTGVPVQVEPRKLPFFKVGKELKEMVDSPAEKK
jgi:integration host factor subunit beta